MRTGRLVEGATDPADGVSRELGGVGKDRFVYSGRAGVWRTAVDIGMRIFKGMTLGNHDGAPIYAPMDGFLRGIARDATFVPEGVKLLEIDPRGRPPTTRYPIREAKPSPRPPSRQFAFARRPAGARPAP